MITGRRTAGRRSAPGRADARRRRQLATVAPLFVALITVGACTGGAQSDGSGGHRPWGVGASQRAAGSHGTGSPLASPASSSADARSIADAAGPEEPLGDPGGLGGFFGVTCLVSRVAFDDPIRYPNQPGLSHGHDFFGAKVKASSTPVKLADGSTSCSVKGDKAGYWTPTPLVHNQPVRPGYMNEYWFDGGFAHVESIPFGFEMIAGDDNGDKPLDTSRYWYYCGQSPFNSVRSATPPDCSASPNTRNHNVIMVVSFPQCWDGLLAQDETPHMAYPLRPGVCPPGYPHVFPRLEEHVHTGVPNGFGFALSSGPVTTLHGDFMNAWQPAALDKFIASCINAHRHCALNTRDAE